MEEIRKIPEGWEHISLNNVGQIITGNTPDTNEDRYYDGKYMFIGPMDINENTLYIRESEKTITEIGLEQTRKIPANSICTVCIGSTIGKIGITSNICATNQQINTLITNKENDYKLIFYAMKYYLQDQLRVEAGLQAVPIVNKNRFSQLKLLVPKSKQEQQKISKILSTLDQNIEKTKQTIEKYINIKNGLMDDLLTGNRRIKDGKWVEEREFKDVDGVGKVPRDWETASIHDIGIEIIDGDRGKNYPNGDELSNRGDCVFLNNKNINTGKIVYCDCDYISYDKDNLLRSGKLKQNDIIITTRGTIGNIAIYLEKNTYPNVRINSGMVILRNYDEKFNSYFLINYWFYIFKKIYYIIGSGSAQPQLPIKDLKQINLIIPELKEQENIVAVLSKQDHLIEKEQQYLQKLKSLKAGLMEDLLTGKVRVKI